MTDVSKGITTIFRGSDALGDARYDFTLEDDDSVTGTIVHVDNLEFNSDAPCVNFLPKELALTDLHLSLGMEQKWISSDSLLPPVTNESGTKLQQTPVIRRRISHRHVALRVRLDDEDRARCLADDRSGTRST